MILLFQFNGNKMIIATYVYWRQLCIASVELGANIHFCCSAMWNGLACEHHPRVSTFKLYSPLACWSTRIRCRPSFWRERKWF